LLPLSSEAIVTGSTDDYFEIGSMGEVRLWVPQDRGALHIKCVAKFGDPVELTEEQVNELIEALKKLVVKLQ
jgi:hypothetical protein